MKIVWYPVNTADKVSYNIGENHPDD